MVPRKRGSDIQKLHDDLVAKGIDIGHGVMDQPGGDRELYVHDEAGSNFRFQQA